MQNIIIDEMNKEFNDEDYWDELREQKKLEEEELKKSKSMFELIEEIDNYLFNKIKN
jgi:hypothetical protein